MINTNGKGYRKEEENTYYFEMVEEKNDQNE